MKNVVSLACTLVVLLATAISNAGSARPDIVVQFDSRSMVDVEFEPLDPVALQLRSGYAVLGTDDASCTTRGCEASLNALVATLSDFELTIEVTSEFSSVGTADVKIAYPTVNFFGPIDMINDGNGFVVPVGTFVQFTAQVSAFVDLGAGLLEFPATGLLNTGKLTSPLIIEYQLMPEQGFTVSGEFDFEFISSQMVSERPIDIDLVGRVTILGSGRTPFRAPR